jgi:hypothetical protein
MRHETPKPAEDFASQSQPGCAASPATSGVEPSASWTDLGGGWARNERGDLIRTVTEIEDAYAEHDFGGAYCDKPFTRLASRKPYLAGGTFIANIDGHLPDGTIYHIAHHGRAYRVCLVADEVIADAAVSPLSRSSEAAARRVVA